MLALREYTFEQIAPHREKIVRGYQELFLDTNFQKAIKASVPEYFVLRVQMFMNVINLAIRS
jgi:hypothetical protein